MNDIHAFPRVNSSLFFSGMTLRDYFAAKAMQAAISYPSFSGREADKVSKAAYMMADEMLKARQEKEGQ